MVEITELAKLLEIPGIEPETAQLINTKLRELIGKVEPPKPLTAAQQKEMLSTMAEWIGQEVGDGNSNGNAAR